MTRRPTDIITAMLAPLTLFERRCEDKTTIRKLITLANERSRRKEAHALFTEIRHKTLAAEKRGDELALSQAEGACLGFRIQTDQTHPFIHEPCVLAGTEVARAIHPAREEIRRRATAADL